MRVLIALAGLLSLSLAFGRPTGAQVPDHLKCFRVRDQLRPEHLYRRSERTRPAGGMQDPGSSGTVLRSVDQDERVPDAPQ